MKIILNCMIATAAILSVELVQPSAVCAQGRLSPALAQRCIDKAPVPYGQPLTMQKSLPKFGKQASVAGSASGAQSGRFGAKGYALNSVGDFPLPSLNFPKVENH